jgi:flagellar FliL protein
MADAEKTEKPEAADAPKAKKKSKLVPILIAGVFVLLAGGGAGGYWLYSTRSASTEPEAAKQEKAPRPGVLEMEPFVVNLADEGGKRFLRVNMKLLTWSEEQAAELKEDVVANARIRSAILELLSLQSAAPLITPEGKEELKQAIAERVGEALGHDAGSEEELKVTDVLFVEFVVQ